MPENLFSIDHQPPQPIGSGGQTPCSPSRAGPRSRVRSDFLNSLSPIPDKQRCRSLLEDLSCCLWPGWCANEFERCPFSRSPGAAGRMYPAGLMMPPQGFARRLATVDSNDPDHICARAPATPLTTLPSQSGATARTPGCRYQECGVQERSRAHVSEAQIVQRTEARRAARE